MRRICKLFALLLALLLGAMLTSCSLLLPVPEGESTTDDGLSPTTPEETLPEFTTPEETTPEETTPEETTPAATEPDFSNTPDPDGTKRY